MGLVGNALLCLSMANIVLRADVLVEVPALQFARAGV